jgi:predicted RNase H-like nuclease
MTPENLALFERLLFRSAAAPEQLTAAAESLGIEATPDMVQDELGRTTFERFPQTAVVSVEVESTSEFDPEANEEYTDR